MEHALQDAWNWLGREIVEFGSRWLIVAMFAFGFGGWFGKRYRDMQRRLEALERGQANEPVREDPIETPYGFVTRGEDGLLRLQSWSEIKFREREDRPPS